MRLTTAGEQFSHKYSTKHQQNLDTATNRPSYDPSVAIKWYDSRYMYLLCVYVYGDFTSDVSYSNKISDSRHFYSVSFESSAIHADVYRR